MPEQETMEFDVIVVGSGAAGLTTAVVAAQKGLRVLVVEKADCFGGTTAYSLGAPWIIANQHQKALGLDDDAAAGDRYLRAALGNLYDPEKVAAYIESGAEMVAYMEAHTEVRWDGIPMPDYLPNLEGFRFGRTLLTRAYDGRVLGPYLRKLRPPLPGFSVFGGMQIDARDAGSFTDTFKKLPAFVRTVKTLSAYSWDRLRFGRGAYLANGNALVGRLLRSALDAKVVLWSSAPAVKIVVQDGGVTGAVIQRGGARVTVAARRGVVLASGGFGAAKELRAKYIPFPDQHVSVQPDENTGDGIRLGQEAGGLLGEVNPENGVWAPVSILRRRDGSIAKYPHFGPDRGKPGSIIVDEKGRRFVDEAAPYQSFVRAMHETHVTRAYFIGNRDFLRKYGMGLALPSPYPIGSLVRRGYLITAPSLAALAKKLNIDPAVLTATVAEFDEHAARGEDPRFGRGANIYDNSQGDFSHKPNPNVGPVGDGPYYAVALQPGDVSTVLGMDTNADGQVRSQSGDIVPGLYAVGLDQNSVMRGVYPGGGSGIGPGMTFGYRAALRLATGH
jgi:succinate dehydrogenase/fumarate reductase flavoprotein subunit